MLRYDERTWKLSLAVMSPHPQDENFLFVGEDFANDPIVGN
jgi:hypothetical protein